MEGHAVPGNVTGVSPAEEGVGALLLVEPLHGASLDELLTELIVLLLGAREDTDILGLEELLVLLNPLDELLVGGHILDVGAAISPEQQTKSTGTVGNRQVPTNPKNKTGISHAFLQSFNHGGCSSWEKKREKEERISPQSRGHYWISFSHTHVLTLLQKEKKRRKRKENH